jgi:RNA polymerase nonessential primary-like sigma factor
MSSEDLDAQSPAADLVRVYLNGIGKTALLTAAQEVDLARRIEAGVFAQHVLDAAKEEGRTLERQYAADLRTVVRDGHSARNHLLEANLRLVVSLAKRYTGRGMPLLDLIQEGNLGLIRAVGEVRLHQGLQVLDLRHVVDPTGDHPRHGRPGPHDPAAGAPRGAGQQAGPHPPRSAPEAGPRRHPRGARRRVRHRRGAHLRPARPRARPGVARHAVGSDEEAPLGDFIEDGESADAETTVISHLLHEDLRRVLATLEDREQQVIRMRYGLDDGQPRTLDQIGRRFGLSRERVRQIEREVMAKLRIGERADRLRAYAS